MSPVKPGGISNASLTGEFEIQFITNANEYTIVSPAAATSTVSRLLALPMLHIR
jgi:hypothetical protein